MEFICTVCHQPSEPPTIPVMDGDDYVGEEEFADNEWNPADGRCYWCYCEMLYGVYGANMEPVFCVDGKLFNATGSTNHLSPASPPEYPSKPLIPMDDDDLPF